MAGLIAGIFDVEYLFWAALFIVAIILIRRANRKGHINHQYDHRKFLRIRRYFNIFFSCMIALFLVIVIGLVWRIWNSEHSIEIERQARFYRLLIMAPAIVCPAALFISLLSYFHKRINTFKRILLAVISFMPLAIFYLLAEQAGEYDDKSRTFVRLGYLWTGILLFINGTPILLGDRCKWFYGRINHFLFAMPDYYWCEQLSASRACAAVMTGKGAGAIASIQLIGTGSRAVISYIFSADESLKNAKTGDIIVGNIVYGENVIDQVTVGCEGDILHTIHCHGNSLIVSDIIRLLGSAGAKVISSEQMQELILTNISSLNAIETESRLALPNAVTLAGSKIIANQPTSGLGKTAKHWLDNLDSIELSDIKQEIRLIIDRSEKAKLLINGCKIVLVGPPNSGKSTLLNCLAGKQKAIVTEIEGTTRDYVTVQCRIGSLAAQLIDTAGLNEKLAGDIDEAAQRRSFELLEKADLIMLVLDSSQPLPQISDELLNQISGKKILAVLNKSELPQVTKPNHLPPALSNTVSISAKNEQGIEGLVKKIQLLCGTEDIDLHSAVCVTDRQEKLLSQLAHAKSKDQANRYITELLKGPIRV